MSTASPLKDISNRRPPVSSEFRDRVQHTLGDSFQIERELAPGGMSRLFLAAERSLDRRVVVKVLPELASEASAQRFQREMLVTAKLQHAHILPVLTAGARDGLLYYVTPFVAGESLRQRLTLHGALSIDEVVRVLREVVDALAFAHALGVVHRDLKPDNILLQHGHAILADFGIVRVVEQTTRGDAEGPLTEIGLAVGTPGYMAPEQLLGDPLVDARADIYAMGVVGYEMLAGHPPFPGATAHERMVAHLTIAPEPITKYRPDTPPMLASIVMRCLEKEPHDRWQTADELGPLLRDRESSMSMPSFARDGLEGAANGQATSSSPGTNAALRAGLLAFEHCEWPEAFAALTEADATVTLDAGALVALAEAAWWIGKIDECIRTRERAYAKYLDAGQLRLAAGVAMNVSEDHFHKLSRSVGHGWMQRAERHLFGLPESIEHGWLARVQAMQAIEVDRDLEKGSALTQRAIAIAQRHNDRDLQMLALQDSGRILVSLGRVAEGMAAIDEAMAAATSGQLGPRTSGRVFCNMMSTCEKLADYRRASEWNEAARHWCVPHAQSGYPGICQVHRAHMLRLRGSWEEAEAEARHASEELEDFLSDAASHAYYELGEIRLRMGDLAGADELFSRAHELGCDPLPGLALLRLAQGETESARALLDRALSDSHLSSLDRARLLPAQAEVALACGARETSRAVATELESIAEDYGSPALVARAALARGLVELGDGQPLEAASHFRRAWKLSKDCELPYEAARARVMLAQAYRASGYKEDARLELRAAIGAFQKLGAAEDARRTTELLEA
jgi:tetratricopeptide (TPR) repeat protein